MEMLKTKEAAELLSVSQTTIKRWAAMFPNFFPKDRFGHYIFTGQEIGLLRSIKERIEHGETLDSIDLAGNKQPEPAEPLHDTRPPHTPDKPMQELLSRIVHIEHSLDQKADEVVSVQLLRQREELEDLRQMIQQLAVSIETIQKPASRASSSEEMRPIATAKLQAPPKKRGLLRTLFSL